MFDAKLRPLIDPPLNKIAQKIVAQAITPNQITAAGFFLALCAFVALSFTQYILALFFILLSRVMDGLDGAVARQTQKRTADGSLQTAESDLGGFLDIVSDFIFYAGAVFFFALGQPQFALSAAFLIFCFMGTGTSFLAYAIVAAKRGISHEQQGKKSFFYLSGLTEGSETIFFLVLMCLFPQAFPYLACFYGFLCLLTTIGRVRRGMIDFGR